MITLAITLLMQLPMLFDFSPEADLSPWRVVDDVVMGGRSDGHMQVNEAGHGVFSGRVSLDNNGGFSSVRCDLETVDVTGYDQVVLRVRGDGSRYQLRIKAQDQTWYSYIQYFETTAGQWLEISLPFDSFYAAFRGRVLDMPPFDGSTIDEMSILIGNKKAQDFKLEIDWIGMAGQSMEK